MVVKQSPSKHAVTDVNGKFSLETLPPGSYTLTFRAKRALVEKTKTSSMVVVGDSYLIKIEGSKRPVNQSSLTSDKLIAGVEVTVEVGSGAKLRGQVVAPGAKRWFWISKKTGSNVPGHWAEESSDEVSGYNITEITRTDLLNPR